jgi:hypothetical protein
MSRTQQIFIIIVAVPLAAVIMFAARRLDGPPSLPPRSSYEGTVGRVSVSFGMVDAPSLKRVPTTAAQPEAVLLQVGKPWSELVAMLGPPTQQDIGWKGGTLALWDSAVPVQDGDPETWPTAHVAALTDVSADKSTAIVTHISFISSLGRIIARAARDGQPDAPLLGIPARGQP